MGCISNYFVPTAISLPKRKEHQLYKAVQKGRSCGIEINSTPELSFLCCRIGNTCSCVHVYSQHYTDLGSFVLTPKQIHRFFGNIGDYWPNTKERSSNQDCEIVCLSAYSLCSFLPSLPKIKATPYGMMQEMPMDMSSD